MASFCKIMFQIDFAINAPSVNFINVLRTAFALVDPESIKKIDNLTVFFTLFCGR